MKKPIQLYSSTTGQRQLLLFTPDTCSDKQLTEIEVWLSLWHGWGWTKDRLNNSYLFCFIINDCCSAIIWFSWVPGSNRVLEAHICVAPLYRKLMWTTPNQIKAMFDGEQYFVPHPQSIVAQATDTTVNILLFLGFKPNKTGLFIYSME